MLNHIITSTLLKLAGPFLTVGSVETCANLTTSNFIQEARSIKTDTCIMIFKAVNCTSYSMRLDAGEYADLALIKHDTVNFVNPQSYRMCTAGEGGVEVNVDISGNAMTLDGGTTYKGIRKYSNFVYHSAYTYHVIFILIILCSLKIPRRLFMHKSSCKKPLYCQRNQYPQFRKLHKTLHGCQLLRNQC